MSIRDVIVVAIILLAAPVAMFSPYFGVLMWAWVAYFNPHRYAWGYATHGFQPALIIAIPTLIGTLIAPKNTRIMTRETMLLAGLWFWFAFTTGYIFFVPEFAGHTTEASLHLGEVSKIMLMTFVSILVVTSKNKLRLLVLFILGSFGFRAMFAAIFYIKTGGQYQIFGPTGSFLEDNNDFALALNMTIPMFYFMARAEPKLWMRVGLRLLMVCVIISVIGTYSRGGLVGLGVITLAIVAKSRQKVIGLILVSIAVLGVLTFTTEAWKGRMKGFMEGNLDESAYARLIAWGGGWNLAMQYPVTGGGFDVFTDEGLFPRFVPPNLRAALYGKIHKLHSSHSIYFQLLGEQGFVGLGLFIILLFSSLLTLRRLRKQARFRKEIEWVVPYTHMFEVSLLAYMANGATLGRGYFDFFYQIIACIILLQLLSQQDLLAPVPEQQEAEELEAVTV